MRNVYDAYEAGLNGLGKRMTHGIRPSLMLRSLLVLACLLWGTSTYAADFAADRIYYNILPSEVDMCEVTSGGGYAGEIVIPQEVVYEGRTLRVVAIGASAFSECYSLTSVTIGESVVSIGDKAFFGCSGLTSVVMPESVVSIGDAAFMWCSGLMSIAIPESVTGIGDEAFGYCSNLKTVYSYPAVPPTLDTGNFTTAQCQNMVLYVPKGTLEAYRAATNWGEIVDIREMDGTDVPNVAGSAGETEKAYYDMQGRRLATPQRGLNIIDGRKVLVRE